MLNPRQENSPQNHPNKKCKIKSVLKKERTHSYAKNDPDVEKTVMNDTVEIVQLAIVTMIRGANTSCEINGVWLLYCSCSPDESHGEDDKE